MNMKTRLILSVAGGSILTLLGCTKATPSEPTPRPAVSPLDPRECYECWRVGHVIVDGRQVACVIYQARAIDCDWPNATRLDTP